MRCGSSGSSCLRLVEEGDELAVLGGERALRRVLAAIALDRRDDLAREVGGPAQVEHEPTRSRTAAPRWARRRVGNRAGRNRRAPATTSANAISAAIVNGTGSGQDCEAAPPVTLLIDVPVQGSSRNHSADTIGQQLR